MNKLEFIADQKLYLEEKMARQFTRIFLHHGQRDALRQINECKEMLDTLSEIM